MKNIERIIKPIKAFNRNLSIQNKIFFYNIPIIILSLLMLSYFSNRVSTNAIIEKATKNSNRELTLIVSNLDSLVNNINNYTITMSLDTQLQDLLRKNEDIPSTPEDEYRVTTDLLRIINTIKGLNSNISSCDFASKTHKLFDVGIYKSDRIYSVLSSDTLNQINLRKSPIWMGPLKLQQKYKGEEDVFIVSKAVIEFDSGNLLGTVLMYINEKGIASTYMNNIGNNYTNFYILDQNNTIVSSSKRGHMYGNFLKAGILDKEQLSKLTHNGSLIANINNKQSLVTALNFSSLNWQVISIVPIDEISTENKAINRVILIVGALCLLFAFMASFLLSRSISKPILRLAGTMRKIKQGDMDIRANVNSEDEIGLLSTGFNSLMDRIKTLMDEIYLDQKLKREYEFRLLQSQIKPHFLYNTLETIISFVKLKMSDEAISSVKYLANFYRISLSKGNDVITIGDETQLIKSYLSLQKLRYIENVDFTIDIDEGLYPYKIPKLSLQPLVENSIYHGLKEKQNKGLITITGHKNGNTIILQVHDNGVGMSDDRISKVFNGKLSVNRNEDFGLASVDARIKLLYGSGYGITINSELGIYTKVTVTIPAIEGAEASC